MVGLELILNNERRLENEGDKIFQDKWQIEGRKLEEQPI